VLEENPRSDLVAAAGTDQLDGAMKVGFAVGELLGQWERVPGLDQHVEPPALDFRALSLLFRFDHFDQLTHAVWFAFS
jgi:hypothetical protein